MIADKLQAHYATLAKNGRRPFKFGPSSLGACLRQQAFLLSGMEPAPLEPEPFRVFELGHQRGERLEALAKELWPDAQSQVAVRIPLGRFALEGTSDLWIPSLRTVVDFKTIGAYGAGLLASEGVSEEHQLQVHAYRDAIDKQGEWAKSAKDMRAFVIYEVKDSDARKGVKAGSLIEREVPWSEDLEERYQKRLMEIEGLLIRKEQGTLDPFKVPELPLNANGTKSWKCKKGICSIGEERGGCYK